MPASQGTRKPDELYRLMNDVTASEWRGIMRELLGYRMYEPTSRKLIDELKREFGIKANG